MKLFVDTLELFFYSLDLPSGCGALPVVQLCCFRAGQSPLRALHNRGDHLQITDQFRSSARRAFFGSLTLGFKEQRGIVQNAFAARGRSSAPGSIQLPGFARVAAMLGEDHRHALTILQALSRYRHQKLHRHLGRDLAVAHLLLDGLRQQLHQRQAPRHPTHAAVELSRQPFQAVLETLRRLLQQPAHFQGALWFGETQRAVQQHGRGFA